MVEGLGWKRVTLDYSPQKPEETMGYSRSSRQAVKQPRLQEPNLGFRVLRVLRV